MKKPRRFWSADDIAAVIRMREVEREKWAVIDRTFDRAPGSAAAKYESLRRGKPFSVHQKDADGRVDISTEQETERRARKEAEMRRDITAEIFGDPPPGFSALDQRQREVQR